MVARIYLFGLVQSSGNLSHVVYVFLFDLFELRGIAMHSPRYPFSRIEEFRRWEREPRD